VRTLLQGPVTMLPGFAEGQWWVQDAAAALPARLFGDLTGKTVADLCAAPGGKTAQLVLAGAEVTAVDRSPGRMTRLRDNFARLSLRAESVVADAAEWDGDKGGKTFDGILVDAPCASTGTIRRHPDVAWIKRQGDLTSLVKLQAELLDKAIALTRPGGAIVYCVCSLEPEEGEAQIAAVLRRNPDARRLAVTPEEIGGLAECVTPSGDLRTLPCHLWGDNPRRSGLDGFFAARLVKTGQQG
jgi:16S rRNA (cytosine967-C5)-methyltransferase